jgi:hypothetical protein
MVTSPKLSFIANSNNSTVVGLTSGKTIRFDSLEFIADRLGRLSLSPKEQDSSTIFVGMVHTGSPSSHTIPEDSTSEGAAALATGGSSGSPGPRACNVVNLIVPITTTPALENTPALQTAPMVTVQIAASQPGMELFPVQQQAYTEEHQVRIRA